MIAPAPIDTADTVRRVLLTCEALQKFNGPVSAGSLALTLQERAGRPWSKRTVLRDLASLQRCGYVASEGAGKKGATTFWRWVGSLTLRPTG